MWGSYCVLNLQYDPSNKTWKSSQFVTAVMKQMRWRKNKTVPSPPFVFYYEFRLELFINVKTPLTITSVTMKVINIYLKTRPVLQIWVRKSSLFKTSYRWSIDRVKVMWHLSHLRSTNSSSASKLLIARISYIDRPVTITIT